VSGPDQLGGIPQIPLPLVALHQLADFALEVPQDLEFGEELARGIRESHEFVFAGIERKRGVPEESPQAE